MTLTYQYFFIMKNVKENINLLNVCVYSIDIYIYIYNTEYKQENITCVPMTEIIM